MEELIFAERFLKFIYSEFTRQIETGMMNPELVYKSDEKESPLNRIGKLEIEVRKINNVSSFKILKAWIEAVDEKGRIINELYGAGKTDNHYLVYTYDDSFGLLFCSDDKKFKHQIRHGYFAIIDYIRKIYSLLGIDEPIREKGFETTLSTGKMEPLRLKLIEKGYIAQDTNLRNFAAVFSGEPLPDSFDRIKWIKHPSRDKNTPAKKALQDLLILMGTPREECRDISKIEKCFADPDGKPLKYFQSNFDNSKDNDKPSEFYSELTAIINSL